MQEIEPVITKTRKPSGDSFRQQKMSSWGPVMTPSKIIVAFIAIGIFFIPTGTSIYSLSKDMFEQRIVYDGSDPSDVQCQIDKQNEGKKCKISFTFDKDVTGPVLVYYELKRFYQNHRIYVNSYSYVQLQGANIGKADKTLSASCGELAANGTLSLNPCGLIANSFFTDIVTIKESSIDGVSMVETGLVNEKERLAKFKQVEGFVFKEVSTAINANSTTCAAQGLNAKCKSYTDKNTELNYLFYYPSDDTVQYLYETYPKHISPILGVTDEHFIVWMRTASLPKFKKLYGRINNNFKKGDTLDFEVEANFEVRSFNGDKSIVIATTGQFGGKNPSLGIAYMAVGSVSMLLGLFFAAKQLIMPRPLGDPKMLNW
eukprot:CAMPEP_0119034246 /NCGR_PEP_ID=MMETSP1177-20130426/1252_1 /TAXON_ID=2985 /ORGANISM="Ochromonas sp, Strain CCMP1899" /LENGTH=372 /DNA_ID=CAMNT_0006991549 /DNA_START=95 /DNA_END=1210 /DNA_ORIENTATION=+